MKGAVLSCSKTGCTIVTMMRHHPYSKLAPLTDLWYTSVSFVECSIPSMGLLWKVQKTFQEVGYDWRRQGGKSLNLFDFQSYSLSASCLLLCEYFPPLPFSHYCEVLPNHWPKINGVKRQWLKIFKTKINSFSLYDRLLGILVKLCKSN